PHRSSRRSVAASRRLDPTGDPNRPRAEPRRRNGMSFVTHFVSASPATYAIVFGIVAIDSLFPFAQAEAVVITAAVLAAQGDLVIWLLVPIVALAGFVGDNASYLVGRNVGCRIAEKLTRSEHRQKRLEQAQAGIRDHGRLVIVVGRFLPVGRTLTTLAAGTLEMRWRRFVVADAIAAVAWASYACALGYAGGSSFEHSLWKPLVFALGIAVLIALAVEAYRRAQKRRGRELLRGELR
ncbi:MAG TPA: DedA family protein, partial [Gaiellaceae bacterium]|nr:DedA family protein [Gaiellaceae bacterium]